MNKLYNLFKLQCADLLVLEEMEWNGIVFNTEKALLKVQEIDEQLQEISKKINIFTGGIPFNPASNDHVSALLYGGIILDDIRIPIGTFKTGAKIGQTRYKIITKEYELPRLTEPLKDTETAKSKKRTAETGEPASLWEVNENTLRSLKLNKKAKEIVDLLGEYGKLEKLKGTYLIGYSNLIKEMNWEKDMIHQNLNMCVTITGRLSSSKPNMQNSDPQTKVYMISRYEN